MATSPDTSPHFEGFYNRSPGISSVGSYQVAGTPFMTGGQLAALNDEVKISFPSTTKSITVINKDAGGTDLRVHFADLASVTGAHNYITLDANNSSVTLNVKCKEIWVSNAGNPAGAVDYELFAELTGIAAGHMWTLTGPGIDA
ncbi:MAG: hypothetical protein NZ730_00055 [Porticoccaceae bacterium]|nr:hypothetical protein [Porticoccaceae bacterium]